MNQEERDRRRRDEVARLPEPASPVNLLILTIVTVLGATAAATAMLGRGYDDATPHGRALGALERLADAQERYHERTGIFALWVRSLEIRPIDDVRVTVLQADSTRWEAVAEHEIGLTCAQRGAIDGRGNYTLEPAGCYTMH